MTSRLASWRHALVPALFLACVACGRTDRPSQGAARDIPRAHVSIEARKHWLSDVLAAELTGPRGALPPMLVVEKTDLGLKLHHFGDGPMCVRVARVEGGKRCWFAHPEQCETLRPEESVDFVEPDPGFAGGCPNGSLEFRVGVPLGNGTTWWTDTALAEFAATTKALEDGEIDEPPRWEDGAGRPDSDRRSSNRVEAWRAENARFVEAAKIREQARMLAGEDDVMPTHASFARQLETLQRLEREKLWSDLEYAGAIGEPGDLPPMFVVIDRRGEVRVQNISERSFSVMLKRSTNRIDPMRTHNPCMFNVEYAQIDAGGGYEFSGFPEGCEAGPLRFHVHSEGSADSLEWWSRTAIEEYQEKSAFNAQLIAREGHGPKRVHELVWQMRSFPPILNDTERAERWRREIEQLTALRRSR